MRADRIFIVASNLDDSIKRYCPSYDITLFPDFPTIEQYIESTPDTVHTIIVTEDVLQFTGSNMARLVQLAKSEFLTLESRVIYLYSKSTSKDAVSSWISSTSGFEIVAYQGDITDQFIIGIINGKLRDSDEEKIEEVTYRYRASEYIEDQKIKRYNSDNNVKYDTDDDELACIPDVEQAELYVPINESPLIEYPIIGFPGQSRTLLAFIEAQYLSLTGKTLILESDVKYHRLTDIALKSDVKYDYFDVTELSTDISGTIDKIKRSQSSLIVIGSKTSETYSYNFYKQLLSDTLTNHIQHFVQELEFNETPFNGNYSIVFDDNIPDMLRTVGAMIYPPIPENNVFVGVRYNNFQPYHLTTEEITTILCELFGFNSIVAQAITINGSSIKREDSVYDLLSIIGRGNRR